jgi:hypothetical protein
MEADVRTMRGKLVGRINKQTNSLSIKDGAKTTQILIPPNGLRLVYTAGDGISEEVFIPAMKDKPQTA